MAPHIELNEDSNEAALREVKEEVGLSVKLWDGNRKFTEWSEKHKELIPLVALNRHRVTEIHEHVTDKHLHEIRRKFHGQRRH